MANQNSLASRIQLTREARGMSRSAFARLVGVTPTAVWNWEENGTVPRPEMLATIAKALGVSEDYLTQGKLDRHQEDSGDKTVAEMVDALRVQIATATGFSLDQVMISVQLESA